MTDLFSLLQRKHKCGKHGHIPVVLAPMAGVTDTTFRELCITQGCDFTFTEMVSAKGVQQNNRRTIELVNIGASERPCGVQLFGSDPDVLCETAQRLLDLAQGNIAVIDINMGCPTPKITGNGEGAALMRNSSLASKIIYELAHALPVPVSIKFRKGWDECSVNAVEFAVMAQESGAAFITLHGRTREQFYSGTADWDIIARVKQSVSIPVIGNGDVTSGDDAVRLLEKTNCDGIMLARAAQGNPFIFKEICSALCEAEYAPPTAIERIQAALEHAYAFMQCHPPKQFIELRKHMAWYSKGIPGANELRRRINTAGCFSQLAELMLDFQKTLN